MKNLISLFLSLLFAVVAPLATADQATDNTFTLSSQSAGVTPFIAKLTFTASDLSVVTKVRFSITPKPGSVTRPLSATYTKAYLGGRGYVDPTMQQITVPVFGLYDGFDNQVVITCLYSDGSAKQSTLPVQTAAFSDPPFNNPNVVQARTNTTELSYDYILVASSISPHSPTIIDTDGALRWVGTSGSQNHYTAFFRNGVYHFRGTKLIRMELDGEFRVLADFAPQNVVSFNHNIDPGKYGLILDANTKYYVDCVHFEVDAQGRILKKWNLADIIRDAMIAGGDDPTGFVRPSNGNYGFGSPADWAHTNAVTYRKSDDTIIISSRENFVIGIDYKTSAIKWILGDTTKEWYQYPSLRKFALALGPNTIAPDGQHAVSITQDDHLLLLDNGEPSAHHTPAGPRRTYAAGRKYELDLVNNVATEVWTFDNNQSVKSAFRSSIYEDAPENYLVDYAVARNPDGSIRGEILGLLPSGEKVFDYTYPTQYGFVAYRSIPIHLENLKFPAPRKAQLANISARSQVKTGDDVAIDGFIIDGPVPKTVVVRGLGPSLQSNGEPVPGRLLNPTLELRNNDQVIGSNDDYQSAPNANEIADVGLAPADNQESALLMQLAPGAYTALLRGADGTTGIGLLEIYGLDETNTSQLGNLSARAFTSNADNVLISGLILQGDEPRRVLFRALGPELQNNGVADAVPDTILEVYNSDGMLLASNDDWQQAANAAEIEETQLAPTDSRESAFLMELPSGSYTSIARGKDVSGVALLEAYQLD